MHIHISKSSRERYKAELIDMEKRNDEAKKRLAGLALQEVCKNKFSGWSIEFPPFLENMADRPTNYPINQRTEIRAY